MAEDVKMDEKSQQLTAIILAAGKSTRMITDRPKVLHEVCGRPMLAYVLDACRQAGVKRLLVVIGYHKEQIKNAFADAEDIVWVEQEPQLGTGHAVMCCQPHLQDYHGDLVILCGDGPLVRTETILALLNKHRSEHAAATLATAILEQPGSYGRIIRDSYGNLQGIVEFADCNAEQAKIREINPSYYCFDCDALMEALDHVQPDNVKGEYYLTDALQIMIRAGKKAVAITAVDQ